MGEKRTLNGVRKCDGDINRRTDISTYGKNWPRVPILRKKVLF